MPSPAKVDESPNSSAPHIGGADDGADDSENLITAMAAGLEDVLGGEKGIRTLGTEEPYAGFRIRCFRPLSHLSV